MNTNFIDEYQNQVREWQNKVFETWMATFPGKGESMNISEVFDKTLNFQQEFCNITIKAQQVAAQLAIEAQQKFVDGYFSALRKAPISYNQNQNS